MKRALAFVPVILAFLTVGCGGKVGQLLATVPPPVELTAGAGTPGLAELPAGGAYRGSLIVERVTMAQDEAGAWTQTAVDPVSTGRAEAEIDKTGTIQLRRDEERTVLFSGPPRVVPGTTNRPAQTLADLIGPDRVRETYPYLLRDGNPKTLRLVVRASLETQGRAATFVRYVFDLSP